jgi:DNA-binding PadR family transcriptional regulator
MKLNEHEVAFLSALAGATDVEQKQVHLVSGLVAGGYAVPDISEHDMASLLLRLYRKGLIARRTNFGVPRYAITEEGRRELAVAQAQQADRAEVDTLALAYAKADQDVIALRQELAAAQHRVELAFQERERLGRELDLRATDVLVH